MHTYVFSISFILITYICVGQNAKKENYTFISELQFAIPKENIEMNGSKISKEIAHVPIEYVKERRIKLVGKTIDLDNHLVYLNIELVSKEDYWNKDEYPWTEVRLTVPKDIFSHINTNIDITRIDPIDSIEKESLTSINKFDISIHKEIPTRFINQITFKTRDAIYINAPEDLSIDIILDYLQKSLSGKTQGIPQFLETVNDLNRYRIIDSTLSISNNQSLKRIVDSTFLTFEKFKNFNSLLLFLEPYITETSFLNREATKLDGLIKAISVIVDKAKNNKTEEIGLKKQLLKYNNTYKNYEIVKAQITNYYEYLKIILYENRNSCYSGLKLDSNFNKLKNDQPTSNSTTLATFSHLPIFTMGLVTAPIKIRLGNDFDFQSCISFGLTSGVKFRLSESNLHNSLSLMAGASISTITLDSASVRANSGLLGQTITNTAVLSPMVGVTVGLEKIYFGFFYGLDLFGAANQQRYGWRYNKKPWISLGLGYEIFNITRKASTQKH